MRIVVVGASGQLGTHVVMEAQRRGIPCLGLSRSDCDLAQLASVDGVRFSCTHGGESPMTDHRNGEDDDAQQRGRREFYGGNFRGRIDAQTALFEEYPTADDLRIRDVDLTTITEAAPVLLGLQRDDVVINTAGYTNVDMAEQDVLQAVAVNGLGPSVLAWWCHSRGARLIHISTDYVFDGVPSALSVVDFGVGNHHPSTEDIDLAAVLPVCDRSRQDPCRHHRSRQSCCEKGSPMWGDSLGGLVTGESHDVDSEHDRSGLLRGWEPADPVAKATVVNRYGYSKRVGEIGVLTNCDRTQVIRTAWVYTGPSRELLNIRGGDFVNTMAHKAEGNGTIRVVNDQTGSPTYVGDLAHQLIALAQLTREELDLGGRIFHCAGRGEATWFDLAQAVFSVMGQDPRRVLPSTSSELNRPARRPKWSVLSPLSWDALELGSMPRWRDSLEESLSGVRNTIDWEH